MSEKKPLGWREWIGFPDLRIPRVKAKIDTGARTSALHAFMVEPFAIHPVQGDTDTVIETEAPLKDRRVVRDSGGHEELRYVIETRIAIGDDTFVAEVTLTDRDSMRFRALLGRTALKTNYVIHPGKSYIQSKIVDRQESQKS